MNRIQLLILWALALVAGAIVFNLKGNKTTEKKIETALSPGEDIIKGVELPEVTSVVINAEGKTTTASKKDDNWIIEEQKDFPVNIATLQGVIDDLQKAKIVQSVSLKPEFHDRFNLDLENEKESKRPKSVTLKKGDEVMATYYIGKKASTEGGAGSSEGRYLKIADKPNDIYIIKDAFKTLEADPKNWITKTLTLLTSPIRVAVKASGTADQSWSVSRTTSIDDFKLEKIAANKETVSSKLNGLKNFLTQANFTELASEEEVKEQGVEKNKREITVTDSSGSKYLFTVIPEKIKVEEAAKKDEPKPATPEKPTNFFMSFKILGGPSAPVKPTQDASVQLQAEYKARLKNMEQLQAQLDRQRLLEGRYFKMAASTFTAIDLKRSDLIKDKPKPKVSVTTPPVQVPSPNGNTPPNPLFNGGQPPIPGAKPVVRPKPTAPKTSKKRIEAVTPPIAIPPRPPVEKAKPAEQAKPKEKAKP